MTYVGKILVLLIMAMSLVFLGVSVTAFVTVTNWKEANAKTQAELKKAQGQLGTRDAEKKDAEAKLEQAKSELATTTKKYEDQVAAQKADLDTAKGEVTQLRTTLTDAQANAALAVAEAQARTQEMTGLRGQLGASIDSGNKLKIEQTDKNVQILTLQRQLDASERSAKGLRENLAKALGQIRTLGGSIDVSRMPSVAEIPSDVEGKVLKVDERNKTMELSIGSDDGVYVGMELYLFRTQPVAEYLGKVQVKAVDPDQSVAAVVGYTVHGKKIKEGDNVSSTLRSK